MTEVTVESMVETYKNIAAAINTHEEAIKSLKSKQDRIAVWLLNVLQEQGLSSMRTPQGLVKLHTPPPRLYTTDMDAFRVWVVQNQCAQLFEGRLHQGNVKAWLEEYPDLVPPGLQSDTKPTTVSITK